MLDNLKIKNTICGNDLQQIKKILESTGFFYDFEVAIGMEIAEEYLKKNESSSYNFLAAEFNNELIAYTCYGEIPCTKKNFDLYWIAVRNDYRNFGIGRYIMTLTENAVKLQGGRKIYIETSSRLQYEPTRKFYLKCGYNESARLIDYYDIGDDKVIYDKKL